jgi:hypothetical protein
MNHARPIVPLVPNGALVPQQVPDLHFSEGIKPLLYCGDRWANLVPTKGPQLTMFQGAG